MSVLNILEYPDPRLRTRAARVGQVDDAVRGLVDDLFETMYSAQGIGLAATQVDVHQRILVLDISEDRSQPLCLINPQIVAEAGAADSEEGCLSVPGYTDLVERAEQIRVRALNRDGEEFELEAEGLLAICIQHEMDHLEGKLFVDYLSELKRQRLRKRLTKSRRRSGAAAVPAL